MASLKPIKVYGQNGPNPPKVAIILNELGLPHEIERIQFADVKKPDFLAINPNGRMPAIFDPNTNLTLWESGAIVEYLIERYDTDNKISFPAGSNEAYEAKQWLFFQTTGQAPYYGQAYWFKKYHPENVPSARERYIKEVNRVTGVLEGVLKKKSSGGDGPWLVGDKLSYADICFVTWQEAVENGFTKEEGFDRDDYPTVKLWMEKMLAREHVKIPVARSRQ